MVVNGLIRTIMKSALCDNPLCLRPIPPGAEVWAVADLEGEYCSKTCIEEQLDMLEHRREGFRDVVLPLP